jgi:predicted NBD/HSP70 family sugar kinase
MARQQGLPAAEVEELAAMARKGNRTAQMVFEAFATALGRGVATIISLFNPEAIILTGKVTRASDVYFDYMLKSVKLHTLPDSLANVRIVIANPESNLSSLGAVALILHKIYYSSHISFEEVI